MRRRRDGRWPPQPQRLPLSCSPRMAAPYAGKPGRAPVVAIPVTGTAGDRASAIRLSSSRQIRMLEPGFASAASVSTVTQFFATPEETQAWVDAEIERLSLLMHHESLPGGGRRCFLWPLEIPLPHQPGRVSGVMVHFPTGHETTLTMGWTGWKASAFPEPAASCGRRLGQQLTRSLRKLATVPLYAVSYDGTSRSDKADVWATPTVVHAGVSLRQWPDGAVTFQP